MPWTDVTLNDGHKLPEVGYGTWKIGKGAQAVDQIGTALEVGFDHIDSAQAYQNQEEVGQALRESGLKRSDVFVTTKFSGGDNLPISQAIKQSLEKAGLSYVDLYLIHSPRLVEGDIPGGWAEMEKIKKDGLARSIGVSNFEIKDLELLLKEANIVPAVNQILFHPYVYSKQRPLLEYCKKQGIVVEAYSPLIPVTRYPGGPVDEPLSRIAKRTGASFDQILLAWGKAKGTVLVTNSSKRSRLEGYLTAGDLELTEEEIGEIDAAGEAKYCAGKRIVFGVMLIVVGAGLMMVKCM